MISQIKKKSSKKKHNFENEHDCQITVVYKKIFLFNKNQLAEKFSTRHFIFESK